MEEKAPTMVELGHALRSADVCLALVDKETLTPANLDDLMTTRTWLSRIRDNLIGQMDKVSPATIAPNQEPPKNAAHETD